MGFAKKAFGVFRKGLKYSLLALILLTYANFLLGIYQAQKQIHGLKEQCQEQLVAFDKLKQRNELLHLRLEAQEDPFYVEFLLRKKLKFQELGDVLLPNLQFLEKNSLLNDPNTSGK